MRGRTRLIGLLLAAMLLAAGIVVPASAEAMSLGTATVATNWSANTEFMPAGTACLVDCRQVEVGNAYKYEQPGRTWAEPDVRQAAEYLRQLKEDPAFREEIARAGQDHIREQLSAARCAGLIATRLAEIEAENNGAE